MGIKPDAESIRLKASIDGTSFVTAERRLTYTRVMLSLEHIAAFSNVPGEIIEILEKFRVLPGGRGRADRFPVRSPGGER